MPDKEEFYRDERPPDPTTGGDDGGGGGGGGGGPGGGGWGGGGGGGGGGTGVPDWGGNWGGGGDDGGDDGDDEEEGDWNEGDHISKPYLKVSEDQYLWLDEDGSLYEGCCQCYIAPQILVYIRGDDKLEHTDCALFRMAGSDREYELYSPIYDDEVEDNSVRPILYILFPWSIPGKFTLQTKWQAGHWSHAKVHAMRFIIFGIDLGWRTIPLGSWVDIASISITDDYTIHVNGMKGEINGNKAFVEI